ncbi:hypothetical protein G6L16_008905 [Agrobacterium tumefaciens]|uniref:hypothetical protein n=1 Tax=Agrobacterium tumefaciens TaxID=358 RepID=UPI001573DB16|nr:hypothetical protein [Agrobacterium tumefaciens]NSZ63457.1 hypothetical protein [Agrobacterium tumefaciens]NTA69827.1 hypothetical protein [Agrobacterium tumefaciens]WIE36973.1 hypothetical protein G6L16_008905 [Agrobacterium tumefaciens]
MNIALDYDSTYTADPQLWNLFISVCENSGHDIRIVTARDDRHDRTDALITLEKRLPVIYCRGVAKKWYLSHHGEGFVPDIWIDDKPESILENSTFAPDKLAEWRANRVGEDGCA